MTPEQLAVAVGDALRGAAADGDLALSPDDVPADIRVERPRSREHGDWATNAAMALAKKAGRPPREVAEVLAERLRAAPGIAAVDVAGPGFLNITLDAAAAGELARTILAAGEAYGRSDALAGVAVNVEFISANPTGPLHLGHTRWAAVGDAIARVLDAAGARAAREFYINDRGVQMDRFGQSLMNAAHGRPAPEDGYHGGYITDLAAADRGRGARHHRAARRRAVGRVPGGGVHPPAQAAAGRARGSSGRCSTSGTRSAACTSPVRWSGRS